MSTPNPVPAAPSVVSKVVTFIQAHWVTVAAVVIGFIAGKVL